MLHFMIDVVKDTMNYFRAMVRKQEYSRRALELCTAAIDLSPPNYTAWRYRRYESRGQKAHFLKISRLAIFQVYVVSNLYEMSSLKTTDNIDMT